MLFGSPGEVNLNAIPSEVTLYVTTLLYISFYEIISEVVTVELRKGLDFGK